MSSFNTCQPHQTRRRRFFSSTIASASVVLATLALAITSATDSVVSFAAAATSGGNPGPYCSATMTSSTTPTADGNITLDLINRLLAAHNIPRQNTTPPAATMPLLIWNDALAATARAWAQTCPAGASHSTTASRSNVDGFTYVGENIAAGPLFDYDGFVYSVGQWVKELDDYTYSATACHNSTAVCGTCTTGAQCGHYTQVVWADTAEVGCGRAYCAAGTVMSVAADIYVCHYGPGGNYLGQPPYVQAASYPTSCTNITRAAAQANETRTTPAPTPAPPTTTGRPGTAAPGSTTTAAPSGGASPTPAPTTGNNTTTQLEPESDNKTTIAIAVAVVGGLLVAASGWIMYQRVLRFRHSDTDASAGEFETYSMGQPLQGGAGAEEAVHSFSAPSHVGSHALQQGKREFDDI